MENRKIIKKAWKISIDDLEEPYFYEDVIVYAETRDKAKSKGLTEMFYENAQILTGSYHDWDKTRDPEYTDIKAHRCKEDDIVEFEGEEVRRDRIKELVWCEERDAEAKKIMEENPNGVAVVWAGVYNAYWGANRAGYCSDIAGAGKYSTKEAFDIVRGSDYSREEKVILLDDSYNRKIDERIAKLKQDIALLESKKVENIL